MSSISNPQHPASPTQAATPQRTSKCCTLAVIIGAVAGIILIALGSLQLFGPTGSAGFIASVGGGGTLICVAIGLISGMRSTHHTNDKMSGTVDAQKLTQTDKKQLKKWDQNLFNSYPVHIRDSAQAIFSLIQTKLESLESPVAAHESKELVFEIHDDSGQSQSSKNDIWGVVAEQASVITFLEQVRKGIWMAKATNNVIESALMALRDNKYITDFVADTHSRKNVCLTV